MSNEPYSLAGCPLPSRHVIKDLGIDVDSKLKFGVHIEGMVTRAFRRLGVLFKAFTCREPQFMRKAYVTYIRPLLEYCTQVWLPFLKKYIDCIERVQKSFSHRIPALKLLAYHDRLDILGLETLELRRLRFDLCMYFKIIRGFINVNKDDFFYFPVNPHITRGNDFKLLKPVCKTNMLSNIFACRCINIWNELPNEVVNAPSVPSFKARLKRLCLNKFLQVGHQ